MKKPTISEFQNNQISEVPNFENDLFLVIWPNWNEEIPDMDNYLVSNVSLSSGYVRLD
jgi:hypothetical protein